MFILVSRRADIEAVEGAIEDAVPDEPRKLVKGTRQQKMDRMPPFSPETMIDAIPAGGREQSQEEREKPEEGQVEEAEEEEEGECGFCLFMKGGPCKDEFIAWEKCVEEAEKNGDNIVEKCFEVTGLLRKCMEAHNDYYEPILRAEKAMEEEAARELGHDPESTTDLAEPNSDTKGK